MEEIIINEPYGFIYITTNMVNGKRYIGQKRFEYGNDWHSYLGSGQALKSAIDLYGKENFYKNIVCFCYSEDELNQAEYNLSVFLDVVKSQDWYNMILGGKGKSGYQMSEEQLEAHRERAIRQMQNPAMREHLSQLAKERNNTDEAKAHQSAIMKELWKDDEFRRKVVDNLPDRSGTRHPMFGYQWSEEQRRHMSEVQTGKRCGENASFFGHKHTLEVKELLSTLAKQKTGGKNPKARKVVRLADEKIYDYVLGAAQDNGIGRDSIRNRCKKHNGFMYYDEWITIQND
jgi:group I intron endonuclease